MKRKALILLFVLLFITSAAIICYPIISDYVNTKYQSVVRSEYDQKVDAVDGFELEAALTAAQAYNDSLAPLRFNKEGVQAASLDYDSLLNLTGSGVMGYIEIPALDLNLPIYHGTSEEVLEKGVGHLVGSSLPIGGSGCHSVLTGHSGLAGKRMLSDIDRLAPGDVFYLHVLDAVLAYEVTDINTVLPHETELLGRISDQDLCTLVTCTPFGVNTHRLLVRGTRIPYEEAVKIVETTEAGEPPQSTWRTQYYSGLRIGGLGLAGAFLLALLVALIRRKRRKRHEA